MAKKKNGKVLPVVDSAKAREKAFLEEMKRTESVAKTSGSVAQSFNRILGFKDVGVGVILTLRPTPEHPETEKFLSYEEALHNLNNTKAAVKKLALEDQKAVAEQLIELETRLLEALDDTHVVAAPESTLAAIEAANKK
ncbi:MAG: hypothetical protein EOM68_27440 [Spirochaetia bacterium]|nr:hypothetical protein [Spirochaetia bacterium]